MGTESISWQSRLASFDFEVTKYDWLLVIKIKNTGQYHIFHNDPQGVEDFINDGNFIYVGYNNKGYDNYILKGVLNHYVPEDIKAINDWIIKDKLPGWQYPYDQPFIAIPPTCDISLDIVPMRSLKECEGNMCMDIQESTIDFNIDHPWTKEEFEQMVYYCKHDVDATERLIDERIDYLEAKVTLAEMCGYDIEKALYKTNGQMVAISLGAEKQEWDDESDYEYPESVDFDLVPEEVIEFFNRFKETGTKEEFNYTLAGCPHKYGLGGIHGALPCYFEESTEDRIIVIRDVKSYYPTLLIYYGYLSRNVKEPKIYVGYYTDRLHFKEIGDKKKAGALKLPLNTAYGVSLQEFNDMFDPLKGRSTCITGQVLLTQLAVELDQKVDDFRLIQSNTDGIIYSLPISEKAKADDIVNRWSERTHLEMEEDIITKIIQKDVNNYIVQFDNGKIKNKGGYVSNYPKGSYDSNSLTIVHEAIVRYFIENKPVEDTINACNDPFRFQLIAKTGSTYDYTVHYVDGEEIKVQKVNRLYAVKDERYGVVKKVKKQYLEIDEDGKRRYYINQKGNRTYKKNWETDSSGDYFIRKDTTQNCPDHAMIDNSCNITNNTIDTINKLWYIEIAKKRINDFLGIKEEKNKMAPRKKELELVTPDYPELPPISKDENGTLVINEKLAQIQLYKKIQKVGEWLAAQPWVMDGYNSHQGYEYVRSHKYREMLGKACREIGLIFKVNIGNRQFEKLESSKMNLTTIYGSLCFIDPETAAHEDYVVMADGSDNLDKGIFKAETMMIKYFVLNNFLLPQQQDEIDPEDGKDEKKVEKEIKKEKAETKPVNIVSKEERQEAKEEVVNDNFATLDFVKQLIECIDKIRTVKGKDYGKKTYDNLTKVLNGQIQLPKNEAIKLMTTFEERMDELGLE